MKKHLYLILLTGWLTVLMTPAILAQSPPSPSCEFNMPVTACIEQPVEIVYTGGVSPNATYLWDFNGAMIISGTGQGPYVVKWLTVGMMTVTLNLQWEGQTCTKSKQIHVVPMPEVFHMTGGGIVPAGGPGVHVGLSGSQFEMIYKLYRNGEYTNVYKVGNGQPIDFGVFTQPGNYTCKAKLDGSDCWREMEGVAVISTAQVPAPHICMVTFDTLSHHNKIIWNHIAASVLSHYNIYREIHINNEFEKIGEVPFSQPGIFIDTTANPLVKSDRYKISATDPGGFTSPLSPHHKTIHLNISPGVFGFNLIWNHYEGFEFRTYKIYRKIGTGPFMLLDSIASNVDSYTDFYITSGVCYYYIEVLRLEPCFPNMKSDGFESVVSNVAISAPIGVEDPALPQALIFPNPATDRITVSFAGQTSGRFSADILRPDGRLVLQTVVSDQLATIDVSALPAGLYILRLTGNERTSTYKFLKE